ncbi:hypothetical protein [Clostridium chromiireducens]|nr:hypothetical protein [Clostridium chromiireducens]
MQKAIVIEYEKYGESDLENTLDYMMFFIKDELISRKRNVGKIFL